MRHSFENISASVCRCRHEQCCDGKTTLTYLLLYDEVKAEQGQPQLLLQSRSCCEDQLWLWAALC